ncbi:MAG: hypothetical protein D6731_01645 [Planctomycetota bacterium]|nr:MAG: hypothetical protein D6731_01645 [Planctomycetota bacterium]
MEEGLFHNPVFVNYVNEFAVSVVGHRETHDMIEVVDPRTRERKKVCPRYPTIPCEVHARAASEARQGGGFQFRGVPASFVCDSSGKQLAQVRGMSPQAFIDALKEAQRTIGKPPLTATAIAELERDLLKGDKLLAKGKYAKAHKAYAKVAEDEDLPTFVRARARERLERLEQAARSAVDEARALPPAKAKRALKKLLRELAPFPAAKKAVEEALAEAGR